MTNLSKILLVVFVFLSINLNAQSRMKITVFSENGERFWLIINGEKINEKAEPRVVAEQVAGESWQIKVIFENQELKEINQNAYKIGNDRELTYVIKKKRKKMVLRLFGMEKKLLNEFFRQSRIRIR